MLKEMFTSVDESFHSHVGEIKSPEAALDAIKIGGMIAGSFCGGMIPNYDWPDPNLFLQSEMVKKEEEIRLEEHKNDPIYDKNFRDICDWFKDGLLKSGKTRGQKLRHLEKEFLTRKRPNLNSLFGEE
jgi:hypothetical protein